MTVFSHYPKEFEELKKMLLTMGSFDKEHNGLYVKLDEPIELPVNRLDLLRVRQPDTYRMQVGCNDFEITDYDSFKKNVVPKFPNNLRVIDRLEFEMIEFFDPDFDVLAYTVKDK